MNASDGGIIERAFHFAKAGHCETLGDVAKKLKAEGFGAGMIERHFDGLTIRTQLSDLCRQARAEAAG